MNLTECNICKKKIKEKPVRAGIDVFRERDFCLKCGKPVLDFLKKHKFIDEDKIKKYE